MPPSPTEGLKPWYKATGDRLSRAEASSFCRTILESDTYRLTLKERAEKGRLSPLVEVMLWNYAYGKPPEEIKLSVEEQDLSSLTTEQLTMRAELALAALQEAKRAEEAIDVLGTVM